MGLGAMPKLFISYRREETLALAGRVYDRLIARFGPRSVVMDIDAISPGMDFRDVLASELAQCHVVLAVMGRGWLNASEESQRRLENPRDFVRIEIETALSRGIHLIPILVADTSMPKESELPESMGQLVYKQAVRLDPGLDFNVHVNRLISAIERLLTTQAVKQEKKPQDGRATLLSDTDADDDAEDRASQNSPSHPSPTSDPIAPKPTLSPALLVTSGPRAGSPFQLIKDVVTIGRSDTCDIVLDLPAVSRVHARLEQKPTGYEIVDAGATNGLFVNDARVIGRQPLREGDRIHIGSSVIIFRSGLVF